MDASPLETMLMRAVEKFEDTHTMTELKDKLTHLEPDEEVRRLSIELSLRSLALNNIASLANSSNESETTVLMSATNLVSLSLKLTECGLCDVRTSVSVLADLLDSLTMDKCSQLFDQCLANKLEVWNDGSKFAGVKPHILRLCNDLLRRSSRSMDTLFCGRIQLFLAKFFPVNERSALNIISEFNLDNFTDFNQDKEAFNNQQSKEENAGKERQDDATSDAGEPMIIEDDSKNLNVDYELYRKIWLLQDYFRNPTQCYDRIKWKTFSKFAQDVLNVLTSFKLDPEQKTCKKRSKFFTKYLTNQNLLQLQLSDGDFRRNILLQFLILFQYLILPVKFKAESQVLTSDQERWVSGATSKVYSLLSETPPDGENFCKVVRHVLKREEQWIQWKNEGCPTFIKAPKETTKKANSNTDGANSFNNAALGIGGSRRLKRKLGDMVRDAQSKNRCLMGNQHLTRLWNICPDNMEACSSTERDFLPDLQSFLRDAFEQLDPNNQVEDEYKKVNDGSWGWRALRLLATKSPHFFTFSNQPIARLPDYLEQKIKKLFAENNWGTLPSPASTASSTTLDEESKNSKSNNTLSASLVGVDEITSLSKKIAKSWSKLLPKLGLSDGIKSAITQSEVDDETKARKALEKWMEMEKEAATKDELLYMLEAIKLKDMAKGILF